MEKVAQEAIVIGITGLQFRRVFFRAKTPRAPGTRKGMAGFKGCEFRSRARVAHVIWIARGRPINYLKTL